MRRLSLLPKAEPELCRKPDIKGIYYIPSPHHIGSYR